MTQPHLMAEPNFAQQGQEAVPASHNEAQLLNESMFHIERGLQGPVRLAPDILLFLLSSGLDSAISGLVYMLLSKDVAAPGCQCRGVVVAHGSSLLMTCGTICLNMHSKHLHVQSMQSYAVSVHAAPRCRSQPLSARSWTLQRRWAELGRLLAVQIAPARKIRDSRQRETSHGCSPEQHLPAQGSEEASTSEAGQRPPDSWPRHFYPHVLPQNGAMLSFLHGIGPSTSLGWCLAPPGFTGPADEAQSARMFEPNTPRTPGGTRYEPGPSRQRVPPCSSVLVTSSA